MDTQELPLEYLKADDKRAAQDTRAIQRFGHGATTAGLSISRAYTSVLADVLSTEIINYLAEKDARDEVYNFIVRLKELPNDLVALVCLQGCLHGIAAFQGNFRDTSLLIGGLVSHEMWAAKLTQEDPKLAAAIERRAREKHTSLKYRTQAARSIAARAGFKMRSWTKPERLRAGAWLVRATVVALPDVFEYVAADGFKEEPLITLTDDAVEHAEHAIRDAVMRHPVLLPVTEKPKDWTAFHSAAVVSPHTGTRVSFLRTRHRETVAAAKAAIASGQMKPALDAVNTLQGVAWAINHRVLHVMQECIKLNIDVPGLPRSNQLPKPAFPLDWETLDDEHKRAWRHKASEVKKRNLSSVCDLVLLKEDMETAERLAQAPRFWTSMSCDWRGRVYANCHFNFQREDRVRGLFLFADGELIGEDGLWWLKVHVANCGDFNKISKRPLAERVQWTDSNIGMLRAIARDPIVMVDYWKTADKPFLFLAACIELVAAMNAGPGYVSRLPVSFDGSCSGLQHLCAMTRASEGSLVNLTPQALPQDVYQTVADLVLKRIEHDDSPLAKLWLKHGITRRVVKRNVMTYSYSSKKFGMAGQQEEDLVTPLGYKVIAGELDEHPFGDFAKRPRRDAPSPAAIFIAKHCYEGIEVIVEKPAQAMAFLQKLAKALAHEGKPVNWVTPTGIPWSNRYHPLVTSVVRLYMHDKGVKRKVDITVAEGFHKEIDKDRAANGIAPNFVHALDAAHLMLTANAAAAEGIAQIATVHDSFGCLASRARRFNEIIRAEFVRMYESHDVLAEVYAQAKCDLTQDNWERLPDAVEKGPLNLKEVINAAYCFA